MDTSLQPYPFDDAWKASVDRSGPEWMAYCEVVSLVKQYIRTRLQCGREAAVQEFEAMCAEYLKHGTRAEARVARIRENFKLVWANEREALVQKVLEENPLPQAA